MPASSIANFYKNFFILLCIFISLFLTYHPVFTDSYIDLDEYSFWGWEDSYLQHVFTGSGRILGKWIMDFLANFVDSIEDVRILHLFNVICLGSTSWVCYLIVQSHFPNRWCSLLFAILIFTLPPFQVLVSHITTLAVGLLLSALSAFISIRAVSMNKHPITWPSFWAILLLLGSLLIHQTIAMFYWFLIALFMMTKPIKTTSKNPYCFLFAVGLGTIFIYYIMLKIIDGFVTLPRDSYYNPFLITNDFWGKLKWFVGEPLLNSLNLWNIYPQKIFAIILMGFVTITFILKFTQKGISFSKIKHFLGKGFMMLFLFLLGFLPNLLSSYSAGFYRNCIVLTPAVVILLLWCLEQWLSFFEKSQNNFILITILILLSLFGMKQAYDKVKFFIVMQNNFELESVKKILSQHDLQQFKNIFLINPEMYNDPFQRYDEFVSSTVYNRNVIPHFILCALKEIGIESRFSSHNLWIIEYASGVGDDKIEYHHNLNISHGTKAQFDALKKLPSPMYDLIMKKTLIIDFVRIRDEYLLRLAREKKINTAKIKRDRAIPQ